MTAFVRNISQESLKNGIKYVTLAFLDFPFSETEKARTLGADATEDDEFNTFLDAHRAGVPSFDLMHRIQGIDALFRNLRLEKKTDQAFRAWFDEVYAKELDGNTPRAYLTLGPRWAFDRVVHLAVELGSKSNSE